VQHAEARYYFKETHLKYTELVKAQLPLHDS